MDKDIAAQCGYCFHAFDNTQLLEIIKGDRCCGQCGGELFKDNRCLLVF